MIPLRTSEDSSLEVKSTFEGLEDSIYEENPEDGSLHDQFLEPRVDVSSEKLEDEDSQSTETKVEEETFDDLDLEKPEEEVSGNEEGN